MYSDATSGDASTPSLRQRVEDVLQEIRPMIQGDGGDVELIEVAEDGEVRVRFHGACVGCPSARMTLTHGIEGRLKDRVPEVSRVVLA